jgi:CRISPR-associated Cas5-like protein
MKYPISIEVAGPLAMFARPDTGGTPTSYRAPTWSACKGIFEAIAFLSSGDAWSCPMELEICKPRGAHGGSIRFQKYTTNYGGPLRKGQVILQLLGCLGLPSSVVLLFTRRFPSGGASHVKSYPERARLAIPWSRSGAAEAPSPRRPHSPPP